MPRFSAWIKSRPDKVINAIRRFSLEIWGTAFPSGWVRGPILAVGVLVLVFAGYLGYNGQSGYGWVLDMLVPAVVAGVGYVLILLFGSWFLKHLFRLPVSLWVAVAVGIVVGLEVWGDSTWLHWVFNLSLVIGAVLIGISVAGIRRDWARANSFRQMMYAGSGIIGAGIFVSIGVLMLSSGRPAAELVVPVARGTALIEAENPGLPGIYDVETYTYGSGADRWRPEYGAEADFVTQPVDSSMYVSYGGWNAKLRKLFFGFDEDALPLNGRVWVPVGEGPFPLVLIVHGNHNMVDFSDGGYAYLGELLASRGFIFVSVDQNFLNGGLPGKSSNENDARAWLLLEHLAVWQDWDNDSRSPFFQKVDLGNIALIGHSRGGEAAALAATFNGLSRYPTNARVQWKYDFGIKSVVAIAPVDQQWQPADHPNPLNDISYLVLQGSHDADLYYFAGVQQFQRAAFTDPTGDAFKAAYYIYRANHGQFNTTWGARDFGGVRGIFLNREALLNADEQEQTAKVLISAFLETTLHGDQAYRAVFQDPAAAGNWLPETGYLTQYEDGGMHVLANFEEDIDAVTGTVPGSKIKQSGLFRWREMALPFRNSKEQDNHAVQVGWKQGQSYYAVTVPEDTGWFPDENSVLVFQAADARDPNDLEAEEGINFSVVLVSQYGRKLAVQLTHIIPLQTMFPAEINRIDLWNREYYSEISEPVFQSYRIPLEVFLGQNEIFNLDDLAEIRFVFDQMAPGTVYLDEIGFDLSP